MRSSFAFRALPWLVAALFIWVLAARTPWDDFRRALDAGRYPELILFMAVVVPIMLLADGWATHVSLAATGLKRRAGEVVLYRGATYLIGQLNYALGQAGIGLLAYRAGLSVRRVTGMVLFLLIVNLGALATVTAAAVLVRPGPLTASVPATLAGAGALYLLVIQLRPRWLTRLEPAAPLFEAGVRGHLIALLARLPHVLVLVLSLWGAMRVWGIAVPLVDGLALVPLVYFIVALPISPAGLGTFQAAEVFLFSAFAEGATRTARESNVLAFAFVFFVIGFTLQVLLAAFCWSRLPRAERSAVAREAARD